jgi:sulfonate transport system permease protein
MLNPDVANKALGEVSVPRRTVPKKPRWASAPARFRTFFNRYLIYWLVPLLILLGWQFLVQSGLVSTRVMPAPLDVLHAAIKLITTEDLFRDVVVSTLRALSGLLVGGSIGFVLGMVNGLSTTSEKLLDSTIQMIRTVPHLALMPLVILWFGIGDSARLFLISLGVFFPIYINTFHGIRNVDQGLIEMGRVYGLTTPQLFWQIVFPGAMPSILVGLRLALGIMWLTLIVAETIAANSGIGYMTASAREFIRVDVMFFAVVLYALLGKLADVIARLLERRLLVWHPRFQPKAKHTPLGSM